MRGVMAHGAPPAFTVTSLRGMAKCAMESRLRRPDDRKM
jgi:hypothetical protein